MENNSNIYELEKSQKETAEKQRVVSSVVPTAPKSKLPFALLIIFLLLLFGYFIYSGIWLWRIMNKPVIYSATPTLSPKPTEVPTTTINETTNWKTYNDSQYEFSVNYPSDFTSSTKSLDYIPPYNLTNVIVILNKKGFQDKTAQYSQDANFTVSSSNDVQNCYVYKGKTITDTKTINGTVYYLTRVEGAAAGHSVDGNLYRTIKGNNCFEIDTVIETETGSGEGLGQLITQIQPDLTNLYQQLDQIFSTFKFLD